MRRDPLTASFPAQKPAPTIRASFKLPQNELEELLSFAASRNLTTTQLLRQAIADELFLIKQTDNNHKVLIETPNGCRSQMLFTR
jgi:hypothetical protein